MLQLLKTQAKFLCLACHLLTEVKGVSPEVSDNFGPGTGYKVSLVLRDYGVDAKAGKVNIGLDAELVNLNFINLIFKVCHICIFSFLFCSVLGQ